MLRKLIDSCVILAIASLAGIASAQSCSATTVHLCNVCHYDICPNWSSSYGVGPTGDTRYPNYAVSYAESTCNSPSGVCDAAGLGINNCGCSGVLVNLVGYCDGIRYTNNWQTCCAYAV